MHDNVELPTIEVPVSDDSFDIQLASFSTSITDRVNDLCNQITLMSTDLSSTMQTMQYLTDRITAHQTQLDILASHMTESGQTETETIVEDLPRADEVDLPAQRTSRRLLF